MRTTSMILVLLPAALLLGAVNTAEAGKVKVNVNLGIGYVHHASHGFHGGVVYDNPQPVFARPVYPAPIYAAPVVVTPICHPVVIPPAFSYVFESRYVPPIYQTQIIGYDHCGRAITRQVLVQAGYTQTLRYRLYQNGAKVFDGYA